MKTTGYIAEVDTPEGTKYVGRQSYLQTMPYFWHNAGALKKALLPVSFRRNGKFDHTAYGLKTNVIKVENLEKGLRASNGTHSSYHDFMATVPVSSASYREKQNVVFKIEAGGTTIGTHSTPSGLYFVGDGKYGKTWDKAGTLRQHISRHIQRLRTFYKGASVVKIEIGPDGITPLNIIRLPIETFYRQSPYSNGRWLNEFRSSLTDFNATHRSALA